jgi:uncharacterized protein DUF6573
MTMEELFGPPIHVCSRAQALADGVLVDLTEWASDGPKGMLGGFRVPVAVSASVWADINSVPEELEGRQDVRGRARDVLWMARLACGRSGTSVEKFRVLLDVAGSKERERTYRLVSSPGDLNEPVLTITQLWED